MNALKFESCLTKPIERFIELRQLGGSTYHSQARLLGYLDRFLVEQQWTEPRLTQPLVEAYEKTLTQLAPRTRANRMCVLRQLCLYLSGSDPLAYVPESVRSPSSYAAFAPYIYSEREVRDLLAAAARLPGSLIGLTYQTLLGLRYSTGLRIGEAMALNLDDFHAEDQRLYIAQGKFHKARWTPLSASTAHALSQYIDWREQSKVQALEPALLINQRGRRLNHSTVNHTFRNLLQHCQITHEPRPRLHDLRHTFAGHRLLAWYREGNNINAKLVWLATYMGHVNIGSTQVYLQPTAALLQQVNDRFHRHYLQHVVNQGVTS